MKILVRQATIADPNSPFNGQITDILIDGLHISKIAAHIAGPADEIIEAAGGQARYPEALDIYRRTAAIWARSLGDEHPDVGAAMNNVGIVLMRLGRYDEALAEHEKALALWERALGPDHPHVSEQSQS